ncbi:MAG: glycosyltransferase family 4 protein [Ruminococcaceae bacterium]|nr:glycosyltransferase family 4 protein [Oscillospiraceae bacterium]
MEELRVCLINDSFPPLIDGVANTVMNYAKTINEKGGKAIVAAPFYPKADDEKFPYKIVRFPSIDTERIIDYRAGYPFSYETLEQIKPENINIIHTHCPFASTVLARTLREPLDAPIIFTYHTKFDVDIERRVGNGYLKEKIIKGIVKNIEACDEVWVVSEGAGENLKSLGYKGDYVVMQNGVDIPKGKVPEEEMEKVTGKYGFPEGIPVFLFVGRMAWYKGLDTILEALEKLKESGEDFRMVFVGGGLDFDEVKKYSEELGLSEKCIFTGPVHDRNAIRAFYSRADLFLFPSVYDTNGLVVREAAACSLPSILIEGSCAAEGIFDCETGFLSENSAESFFEKLLFLCKNPELLKKVGENAAEKIYISWEDSVLNAAERYKTVLENYRAGKYKREQTFADEWFMAEGEFLDYISKAKNRGKNIKNEIKESSFRAAKSFNRRRIKLKKTIIEKIDRYL